jgi:hypothetical protein
MSNALKNYKEGDISQIVCQTKLLNHFSLSQDFLQAKESELNGEKYFITQAGKSSAAGFGRAPTKRLSCVKAIAEHYERKLMLELFQTELAHIPVWLQTSNAFAVHFSENEAHSASMREALERHILQISYFRHGWQGFYQLDDTEMPDGLQITKVLSRYVCDGFQAGVVVARSVKFKGASFGYICEKVDSIRDSNRWEHAIHEAVDKIDPLLEIGKRDLTGVLPITRELLLWLDTPLSLSFSQSNEKQKLPPPVILTELYDLQDRWGLDFPFWGAFSHSSELFPLYVPGRIRLKDQVAAHDLLKRFTIPIAHAERNPIL